MRYRGVDVHVRSLGAGPVVLLINGLGGHTAMWRSVEETLEGFRLLQFDLPGAGQSSTPRTPLSIGDLAQLSLAVMDRFGVDKAHVVGYSMGGLVAQQLAHDAPDRIGRIVLLATSAGRGSFGGDIRATINILTPARYLSARIYAMTIGSLVGGRARHDTEWVAEQGLLRLQQSPSWRGYIYQLCSVMCWSGFPILRKVRSEVLVLAGDDDPLVPVINAMILTHLLPNGRLVVMRDEGHLMMMDPESRIHPAIREFLGVTHLDASEVWKTAAEIDTAELEIALAGVWTLGLPWGTDARLRRQWLRAAADPADAGAARAEA